MFLVGNLPEVQLCDRQTSDVEDFQDCVNNGHLVE
jgi:hypothetical protein